jgi:DNA-binding PadR family transcriptional regulator
VPLFRDRSLIPAEAIRLMALGLLAEQPRAYGDLAGEIRYFTSNFVGPSLDLMGSSIEMLRYQGLIEPVAGEGMADNAVMRLLPAGRAVLEELLQARLGQGEGDINRLALRLKLRFLALLPKAAQAAQRAHIAENIESELARLADVRRRNAKAPALFLDWIDRDIEALEAHRQAIAVR